MDYLLNSNMYELWVHGYVLNVTISMKEVQAIYANDCCWNWICEAMRTSRRISSMQCYTNKNKIHH